MSRRYAQKLLEGTGKSFTEHLAGCRLERAFAMLTDPHHLHLAIIDIAFAVGFGDVLISIARSADASARRHQACAPHQS
ncbi:hypothetical protein [Bradyrhizobium sp. USDA 377]